MTFFAVTCLCLALLAGVQAESSSKLRIVGGTSTTIAEFPFQVSLRSYGRHFCGGSIISQRHILTAGHCLYGSSAPSKSSITVVTGSTSSTGSSGKAYRVSRVNVHPDYTGTGIVPNDVAVITLSSPITFDQSTKQINLPSRDSQAGESVHISGWGLQSASHTSTPAILQKALTTVIGNSACSAQLTRAGIGSVRKDQICTFQRVGLGACNGDSGGPLSANNQIVGIVSFGIPCAKGYPDVFTRVYSYKPWIQSIMNS